VRIDQSFAGLGRAVYRHRLLTLLVLAVLFGGLASQLPRIRFDTSTESFFRTTDPALIAYNRFREQFGRDEVIVVAIDPPEVFDRAFLERLRAFHQALEAGVPHLKEVTSLINVRDTRGEGDKLIVEDLLKEIPRTPEAMAALKRRVLSSQLYPNLLISEDGGFTTVLIETQAFTGGDAPADLLAGFGAAPLGEPGATPGREAGAVSGTAPGVPRQPLTDAENSAVVQAVQRVMAQYQAPDFVLHFTGSPVITDFLKQAMQSNMGRFIALALLAIGAFLGVLFRRISGVVLPLLVVLLSVVSTVAIMAMTGVAFKLPSMVLPSFLLAVGVGASVHLLTLFYRGYEQGADKETALSEALGHTGLPILMASLTTAAGLLSFVTAALASVGDLGLFASVGVLIALVYTLVLLPALLAVLPVRRHPRFGHSGEGRSPVSDRVLTALGDLATHRAGWVVGVSALLLALAVAGLPSLRFSHNTLAWFPKSGSIRQSTDLIDRELKGSLTLEVLVDTGRENGLYEPELLNRLEALALYAESYTNGAGRRMVGTTNSVVDVVKEINQALNENRAEFYRIPQDRELIAQELLLFENSGSDDLERLVDSQFRLARLSVKVPWDDAAVYVQLVDDLRAKGRELFAGQAEVEVTGLAHLLTASVYALMRSMATSYSVALVVITALMILLIGRLGLGLLSMIPNLLPIVMTLGFMGWAGIRLDAFTLLIGSIALGLAVDDTIHFFHHYRRNLTLGADSRQAVHATLVTTGRAMLFTTLVLVTGFWLFMFATLNNLFYFGLLTGLSLSVALLADVLLAPALLELLTRRRMAAERRPA
jgi:hypothetical protein